MPGQGHVPKLVQRCVAAVGKQYGGDTDKAFAICVGRLQKTGHLKDGSMELTAKGEKSQSELETEPDNDKKLAGYEKMLKAARSEQYSTVREDAAAVFERRGFAPGTVRKWRTKGQMREMVKLPDGSWKQRG